MDKKMELIMKRESPDFTKYSDFFDKNNIIEFKAGDYIFRKGDKGNCMFVVLVGEVEVVSDEQVLSIIKKGDIFGDMALVDSSPRSADVRALTDCKLASIDEYSFKFLVKKMPDFTLDILSVVANRLRSVNASLHMH
ncbi:MAG: Crp/Fnr family transcriptional regulator [Smithellaceae bacterium]